MNDDHHFLPQFYLKGFLGDNKRLYYCRKKYETYNDVSPAGIYYEPGLNYIDLGEYGYIDLENDFFKEKDDRYAKAFRDFRDSYNYDLGATPLQTKADIVDFVLGLFWRVPGRWKRVVDVLNENGLLTGSLGLKNKETGQWYTDAEIPNIIQDIKDKEVNQKAFMTYYYHENLLRYNWDELEQKFHIFETSEPMIIGDIPYVPLKSENKMGHILEEFMIPLDKNHIMVYANKCPSFLETNVLYLFYQYIIDGASVRIACSDKGYLKQMMLQSKTLHELIEKSGLGNNKEHALYNVLAFESRFSSFEEFKKYHADLLKQAN